MESMTSRQRVAAAIERKPVDRLPVSEGFWKETVAHWRSEGHLGEDETPLDHFDLDIRCAGWPNLVADLDFEPVVLEETEDTKLVLNGNGAKLRWMKHKGNAPEHVDFLVRDRAGWEEHIKPRLVELDPRRIPFEGYRNARRAAQEQQRFFCWSGVAPFECMHPVCGHEYMLMGMAMDPDWIADMVRTYSDLIISIQKELFAKEGKPDGVFYYEDLGFKARPFMSPEMYRQLIQPGHARLFDYAHSQGLKAIVHSCGYVEPLVPGLVEAGMDCLQAMEVKAGMDVLRLSEQFGDRIAFFGNLDIRELISNDFARIDAEMDCKIPPLLERGCGYIVHSDHSVPSEVEYRAMVHWFERARGYRTHA
jgi:uroporphyrinogen decarboxylase